MEVKPSCKDDSQRRRAAKKTLRAEKLPEEAESCPARKGLDQLSNPKRTLSNLGSCLQAVQCATGFWFVSCHHTGVASQ